MIKIAIIEGSNFHGELLYSQIKYLQDSNHHISLLCNKKLNNKVGYLESEVEDLIFFNFKNVFAKYFNWTKIWFFLILNKYDVIIFNTAERKSSKLLAFPFPKKTILVGTLHNAQNLKTKKYQRFVSKRINKYFVINDFVKKTIQKEELTKTPINSYYPIVSLQKERTNNITKSKDEIWICIPGGFDITRRDYNFLLNIKLTKKYKIILLGKSVGHEFLEWKSKLICPENFILFSDFVPKDIFDNYASLSDYIMPLIHPNLGSFNNYLKYKVSGSFLLAFEHRVPMLLDTSFKQLDDCKENSLFYDYMDFTKFNHLLNTPVQNTYMNPKWEFKFQKKNYLNFIFE